LLITCSLFTSCNKPTEGVIYDLSPDGTYAEVIDYVGTDEKVVIASEYKGKPVTNIYAEAFKDNENITKVILPETLLTIGYSAFEGCTNLKFNEYENCKYLGKKSNPYFALIGGVTNKLSSVTIHDDAKIIAEKAFYEYSRLSKVVIAGSMTSIGHNAFYRCLSLKEIYYVGEIEDWCKISGLSHLMTAGSIRNLYFNNEIVTEN
jgi:hypothetical protein